MVSHRPYIIDVRRFVCAALALSALLITPSGGWSQEEQQEESAKPEPVSFYRQIRPILQRRCSGCHQPAKLGGELLLISYEGFQKGGESGATFEPGKPDESLLIDYISGDEPKMPKNQDPLKPEQVELIARWISEGAQDDTPMSVRENYSA